MEASTLEGTGYPPSVEGASAGGARIWRFLRDAVTERAATSPPAEARRKGAARSRIFRLGVSDGTSSVGEAMLGELEMELALLREENARLKVERHRPPDPGRIIERMRDLRQESHAVQAEDEVTRAVVECLALRAGLLEACQEIQQAMQGMQSRLGTLSVAVEARGADQVLARGADRVEARGADQVEARGADRERRAGPLAAAGADLELAVADGVHSGCVESAA
jgi:hypothetical protein